MGVELALEDSDSSGSRRASGKVGSRTVRSVATAKLRYPVDVAVLRSISLHCMCCYETVKIRPMFHGSTFLVSSL